ncbi:hypothetical protein PSECIP111854_01214 [Pseudoalteromonas sp. CIP111854]|uniref:Uncharacterized protein n=1 Tax=Pseudoalteromonas holothuriae TaxID=2963714 RepID=A0A9W4VPC8_9GAMM|nr:hypothetical protein [Pseudoalteromonas sp. CIP111854]CAH9053663.1 hypothetical protein PSECIP111854_01214 [Pseudoalteromonas sp. CIP111854]
MLYFVLTLVLVAVGGFVFLPRFAKTAERNALGVNFILTLIATLVGVLVAINISEYSAGQAEKKDMIKLLNAAVETVDVSFDYSQALHEHFESLDEQTDITKLYHNNMPPLPSYLDDILVLPIVSKNISTSSLSNVVNLSILARHLVNTAEELPYYVNVLKTLKKVLELEVSYQLGQLNEQQLELQSTDLMLNFSKYSGVTYKNNLPE